jgi:nitrate reductase delta subunit
LLSYPDQHTAQAAELLYVLLLGEMPEAASAASQFGAFVEQHDAWELEEAFTSTFDVNPACALEVGWHLFGEEYARGMFLVRMREELRKYELPESAELPDHISHVLAIVAEMPEAEAARFVRACVQAAVEKMQRALEEKDTPYRHVISCLVAVIEHTWGASAERSDLGTLASPSRETDPLRAYPVAEISCGGGCAGSCDEDVSVVPLQTHFPMQAPVASIAPSAEVVDWKRRNEKEDDE